MRSLLGLVGFSLVMLLAVAGLSDYRELAAARARKDLLDRKIQEVVKRNAELGLEIELLKDEPATLERLAREQYRMAYPGDVIIVLPEDPAPTLSTGGTKQ